MSIELRWDEEQHNILVMTFGYDWTTARYYDALQEISRMSDEVQQQYHVIVDARSMKLYSSAMMLDLAQSGVQRMPSNCGCTVVLTSDPLVETLVRTASALYPTLNHRLYTAHDFAGAHKIIGRYQQRQQRQRESISAD